MRYKYYENGVMLRWSVEVERFFISKNIFLSYPWEIEGVFKEGQLLKIPRSISVEPFSCMAQGKLYSAGAFSYCRSRLIREDFKVGRYCSIAPGVELSDQDHPLDRVSTHSFTFKEHAKKLAKAHGKEINIHKFKTLKAAPDIGNDVWIGKDALIKRGIRIGDGAVVAQKSVVTKDIPDFAVVAGVPARVIRYRFDEKIIEKLKALKWWNYSFFDFADLDVRKVEEFIENFGARLCSSEPPTPLEEKFVLCDKIVDEIG